MTSEISEDHVFTVTTPSGECQLHARLSVTCYAAALLAATKPPATPTANDVRAIICKAHTGLIDGICDQVK